MGLYFRRGENPIPGRENKLPRDGTVEPKSQKRKEEPHNPLHGQLSNDILSRFAQFVELSLWSPADCRVVTPQAQFLCPDLMKSLKP
jgi:hypothetical protein